MTILSEAGIYEVAKYEFFLLNNYSPQLLLLLEKKDMIDAIYNGNLPFAKYDHKGVGPDRFMISLCMLRYQNLAI